MLNVGVGVFMNPMAAIYAGAGGTMTYRGGQEGNQLKHSFVARLRVREPYEGENDFPL